MHYILFCIGLMAHDDDIKTHCIDNPLQPEWNMTLNAINTHDKIT